MSPHFLAFGCGSRSLQPLMEVSFMFRRKSWRMPRSRFTSYRPGVEVLEDRTLLAASYLVGSTPASLAVGDFTGNGSSTSP